MNMPSSQSAALALAVRLLAPPPSATDAALCDDFQ